jgi:hypothetical protein
MRSVFTLVAVLLLAVSAPAQAHVIPTLPHLNFDRSLPSFTPLSDPSDSSKHNSDLAAVPEPSAIALGIVAAALFAVLYQRQRCAIQERPEQKKPSQRWNRPSRR